MIFLYILCSYACFLAGMNFKSYSMRSSSKPCQSDSLSDYVIAQRVAEEFCRSEMKDSIASFHMWCDEKVAQKAAQKKKDAPLIFSGQCAHGVAIGQLCEKCHDSFHM